MKELAEQLGATKGTFTVDIDKLLKINLAPRKPHEEDHRSWLIDLTGKGMRYRHRQQLNCWLFGQLAHLSAENLFCLKYFFVNMLELKTPQRLIFDSN